MIKNGELDVNKETLGEKSYATDAHLQLLDKNNN
ncbi:hypothetical protein II1_00675 [Bacillus cereus MC118]|uniref:Uncharacterized protein n=1 Tax=Bacillus cereus MC67 TaxID=1053219 RepID=J8FC18_BACCE|nr:hypothetical protein II3_03508 [Bacillus cereus MC67]EOP19405.1 hypothetical protein II1_00675 [Bacillus cereus MC118]